MAYVPVSRADFLRLQVDPAALERVNRMLAGVRNGAKRALASSINDTLRGMKTAISRYGRQVYNLKAKTIAGTMRVFLAKANMDNPSGSVVSTGRPLNLSNFLMRPSSNAPYRGKRRNRPAQGVTVEIFKGGGGETYPGSFVVSREAAWPGSKGNKFEAVRRAGAKRFPLSLPKGPPVPATIQDPAVLEPAKADAGQRLNSRLNHYVNRLIADARS
jgi:hypothetical protein